jgi:hypothetical protein
MLDNQSIIYYDTPILSLWRRVELQFPNHGLFKNLAIAFLSFDRHYSPDDPHVRFFTRKSLINSFVSEGFSVDHVGYLGRVRGLSKNICVIFRKK